MAWYKFESKKQFDIWHSAIKDELGYPFLSKDSNGNECEPLNTEYTNLIKDDSGEFKAWVEDEQSAGLIQTESPIYEKSSHVLP